MNKKEAVFSFVNREFDEVPQEMILSYMKDHHLEDITPISEGSCVYFGDDDSYGVVQSVREIENGDMEYDVLEEGSDRVVKIFSYDNISLRECNGVYGLPMWGTMWLLNRSYWSDHMNELAESGFRIYEDFDNDLMVVGIDGAGYSFFDEHFTPLYERMGYEWEKQMDLETRRYFMAAVEMGAELGLKPEAIANRLKADPELVKKNMPKDMVR